MDMLGASRVDMGEGRSNQQQTYGEYHSKLLNATGLCTDEAGCARVEQLVADDGALVGLVRSIASRRRDDIVHRRLHATRRHQPVHAAARRAPDLDHGGGQLSKFHLDAPWIWQGHLGQICWRGGGWRTLTISAAPSCDSLLMYLRNATTVYIHVKKQAGGNKKVYDSSQPHIAS